MKLISGFTVTSQKIRTAVTATVTKVRIMLSLTAVIVLAGGVVAGLNASPAGAATTVRAVPETTYSNITYYNGATQDYPCAEGTTFHSGLPAEVEYVTNHCAVRVWLHSSNNNTGPSLCFSPGVVQQDTHPYETTKWVNFYVSDNSSPC
jgi:hypothetical protein